MDGRGELLRLVASGQYELQQIVIVSAREGEKWSRGGRSGQVYMLSLFISSRDVAVG
jgi:hypothetical protein